MKSKGDLKTLIRKKFIKLWSHDGKAKLPIAFLRELARWLKAQTEEDECNDDPELPIMNQ